MQCWTIETTKQGPFGCEVDNLIRVQDCLLMESSNGDPVYWYGGAEMIIQRWPMNKIHVPKSTAFLSSDLPGRYGNVLERYFISSLGVAIYVYAETPLYVSVFANDQICLEAAYETDDVQPVGPGYLRPNEEELLETLKLTYAVCLGPSTAEVHQAMTDPNNGFIKRPTSLPDLKMMQDPIWSTWARYSWTILSTFCLI